MFKDRQAWPVGLNEIGVGLGASAPWCRVNSNDAACRQRYAFLFLGPMLASLYPEIRYFVKATPAIGHPVRLKFCIAVAVNGSAGPTRLNKLPSWRGFIARIDRGVVLSLASRASQTPVCRTDV